MTHYVRSGSSLLEAPLHGNRGEADEAPLLTPLGMTVAISREAGSRGGNIARRVGKKLGWQVYTQELLEFLCGNEAARSHVLADVPASASKWADSHWQRLQREKTIDRHVEFDEMPRLILTLAARGRVILVGRGAGYILPEESTLHFRIVAPLSERIAYIMQSMRLTQDEATAHVHERDQQRASFLLKYFRGRFGENDGYDMVVNSFRLGEEVSAEMIAMAVRARETGNNE